jgi:L-aspartate oxidase
VESHVEDTLRAGAGLCHRDAVELTVSHSRETVDWLASLGVDFDLRDDIDSPASRRSTTSPRKAGTATGGSSTPRTAPAAPSARCSRRAPAGDNIDLLPGRIAVDLVVTDGAAAASTCWTSASDTVDLFEAGAVVLASGGASKVYLYTSNPDGASGDGIAMAWRAGCRVANMEFNQFHPTCLYHPQAKSFLITEALRGEGARLLLPDGERFMPRFDERAELAPRDIVARAIDHEMKRLGSGLRVSRHLPPRAGVHAPALSPPSTPAASNSASTSPGSASRGAGGALHLRRRRHDATARTDVPGLYAIGEAPSPACTAPIAWPATRCWSAWCMRRPRRGHRAHGRDTAPRAPAALGRKPRHGFGRGRGDLAQLGRAAPLHVGLRRHRAHHKRLQRALRRAELLQGEIAEYYGNYKVSNDLLELRNLAMVAELMIRCAMARRESRGLHYTLLTPTTPSSSSMPRRLAQHMRLCSSSMEIRKCSETGPQYNQVGPRYDAQLTGRPTIAPVSKELS